MQAGAANAGLVLELQRAALNDVCSVTRLLRMALVVAKKLQVDEFEAWASAELHGYGDGQPAPEYRILRGSLKCLNPYRGWIPLFFSDTTLVDKLSTRVFRQSAGDLEAMLMPSKKDSGELICYFNAELERQLMKGTDAEFQPAVIIDGARVRGIIEMIRNTVLEWSLKLEAAGVTGADMTFSEDEKKRAANVSISYHAQNQTVVHSMSQSQLQQGSHQSSQVASFGLDIEAVKVATSAFEAALGREKIDPLIREEIAAEVGTIKAQLMKSAPSKSIIAEAGKSLRSISEGALGGALTPAAIAAAATLWNALGLG